MPANVQTPLTAAILMQQVRNGESARLARATADFQDQDLCVGVGIQCFQVSGRNLSLSHDYL